MHIRLSTSDTGVVDVESFVVDSQEMNCCGMKIVEIGRRFNRLPTELIGGTTTHTPLIPTPTIQAVKPPLLWSRPLPALPWGAGKQSAFPALAFKNRSFN